MAVLGCAIAVLGCNIAVGEASGPSPMSVLASPGPDGRLVYAPYANGGDTRRLNTLPDWSACGYMHGGVQIPDVACKVVIGPVVGDNRINIQDAIDRVSRLPLDANGFKAQSCSRRGGTPWRGH